MVHQAGVLSHDAPAGEVIAEGQDETFHHPLGHAIMVAIDAAAARDRRVWPIKGNEADAAASTAATASDALFLPQQSTSVTDQGASESEASGDQASGDQVSPSVAKLLPVPGQADMTMMGCTVMHALVKYGFQHDQQCTLNAQSTFVAYLWQQ